MKITRIGQALAVQLAPATGTTAAEDALMQVLNDAVKRCQPVAFSAYNIAKFQPKEGVTLDDLDVVTNEDGAMTTKSLLTTVSYYLSQGKKRLAMNVDDNDNIIGFSWVKEG